MAEVSLERHLAGPLCSPTRACLLTGRYSYRSRVVDTYCGRSIMDSSETTIAELLRSAGYATGCFGKWHLGDTASFRPEDRGFDETLWHLGGGIGQPGDHPDNFGRESYFDPVLCRNGSFEKSRGYCTDVFTDAASEFIQKQKESPWFCYVAFNAPHTPLQVDQKAAAACASRGATGDLPSLYAMVENIDTNVGRLLAVLDEAGSRENTVVVFMSDHGPCPGVRDGEGKPRFNAGLRGEKGSVYEGGIRVPCLWSGPLPGRGLFQTPTHAIDIAPTFLSLAGIDVPKDFDGVNLLPMIGGNTLEDRLLFLQWHRGDVPTLHRNAAAISPRWKWVSVTEATCGELYDVATDPGENCDMADAEPVILESMRQAYAAWYEDVSSGHGYGAVPLLLSKSSLPLRLTRQDWRVEGADGWESSTKAHWLVRIVEGGIYRLSVTFDSVPDEQGTVVLQCGGMRHVQQAVAGKAEYEFVAELAAGETKLRAGWQTIFREEAPFSVVIHFTA